MNYLNLFIQFLTDASSESDYPSLPSGETIFEKLVPNVWAFLIQFISLIVIVILFFIFAYKPVRKIIKKRQDAIDNEIKSAFDNNKKSQEQRQESEKILLDARIKCDDMIEEAKKESLKQKQLIISDANEEVRQIKINADEDIKRKYESLKDDIHKEIVDVSLKATNELLKKKVTTSDDAKLVEKFIDKIKEQ